ncbi:lysozyme [Microvirga sp. KLBC 81]|uniref:lysozyme n=1 Tax=Microvirga sp. KLBC 81 TaxID=1862707 RepID=UPI000D50E18C|nr:lysozyme [Microvirga sp. KLBC 81]PVE25440.1 lysozyme [Microvirga sp. KLBC 81]
MARKINQEGLEKLKGFEGLRLKAYLDGGGVPTIGYGHIRGVRMGMTCTKEQAETWLLEDLAQAELAVERGVKVPLTDNQFAALVSFTFNVGTGDPDKPKAPKGFLTSTLLKKLNKGGYDAVPEELMKWVNDNGRRVPGLVTRRAAEAGLWAKESFVASNTVPATPKVPPVITKENVTWATGILTTLASSFASGPMQYVFAGAVAVAFGLGFYWLIQSRKEAAA